MFNKKNQIWFWFFIVHYTWRIIDCPAVPVDPAAPAVAPDPVDHPQDPQDHPVSVIVHGVHDLYILWALYVFKKKGKMYLQKIPISGDYYYINIMF